MWDVDALPRPRSACEVKGAGFISPGTERSRRGRPHKQRFTIVAFLLSSSASAAG